MAQQDHKTKKVILWVQLQVSSTFEFLRLLNGTPNLIQSRTGSPCGTTVSSYIHYYYTRLLWSFLMKQKLLKDFKGSDSQFLPILLF